jgi:hypothetical protein
MNATMNNNTKINIPKEGMDPKYMEIGNCWDEKVVAEAITLFIEFAYVFSYTYYDSKEHKKYLENV